MAFLSQDLVDSLAKEASSVSTGRYLNCSKIDGEVRLRFMPGGLGGFESWTVENKPKRWEKKPAELPENIKCNDSGGKDCKRFIAGIVYDYSDSTFKCIVITQKTIIDLLVKYINDEDYGDPENYDVKIGRTGEKLLTQYTYSPAPPKPLSKEIDERWHVENKKIKLENLLTSEEVFLP